MSQGTSNSSKKRSAIGDDVSASKLASIDSEIVRCTKCRLHEGRTHAVPGEGPPEVDLMIVGEAPGRNEDIAGKPFVGSGGRLLDSILKNGGIDRREVYITNVVKCRPPNNRKPKDDEVETCTSNYLDRQIEILKPKLVCTLGATSLEYFTGEKKMGENHGRLQMSKRIGTQILPTYHPAAIFRNGSLRKTLEEDVKKIPLILKDLNTKRKDED